MAYDSVGNQTVAINPLGFRTSWTFNVFDKPASMQNALAAVWTTLYDALGQPIARGDDSAAGDYILEQEDTLDITVSNHADLNKIATISADGTIAFPEIGEVKAAGLTTRRLAATLKAELERTLNNVLVSVTVRDSHVRRVRLLGAVKMTGPVDIRANWRLLDAIAAAGGLSARPGLITGRIVRAASLLPLDVPAAFAHPEGSANRPLATGDLILLDEMARPQIVVVGQVEKPGLYDLDETTTVASIVAQSGHPAEKAALSRSYVLRNGERISLDLRPFAAGRDTGPAAAPFRFAPKDILFVPENTQRYSVLGDVRQPGTFSYPENATVTALEALMQVGGNTADGDLAHAGIVRYVQGRYTVHLANLARMLQQKGQALNEVLQPGDILFVPARKRTGFQWQSILSGISALGLLGLRAF